MTNLVNLIADELARIFPGVTIYSENQRSGFVEPCFYINKVSSTSVHELFDVQNRKHTYQVVYFTTEEAPNADLAHVEEALLDNFNALGTYAAVRNREIQQDSTERILTMTFEIWMRMYKENSNGKEK